jgi:Family of unknown function (DUF6188)
MMDLGFAGQKVTATEFGYAVRVAFSGGYEIAIEVGFTLRTSDGDHRITPGENAQRDAALLDELIGQVAILAAAGDDGGLRVDLDGGAGLLAGADPDYEAWTFAGPGGMKVVCLPGGGLSVWSPQA